MKFENLNKLIKLLNDLRNCYASSVKENKDKTVILQDLELIFLIKLANRLGKK